MDIASISILIILLITKELDINNSLKWTYIPTVPLLVLCGYTVVQNVTEIVSPGSLVVDDYTRVATVITLMVLLATRELASAGSFHFSLRIAKFAGVGILSVIMTFAVIVAVEIAQVL